MMDGGTLVILPAQRPLLEYYANSIRHLLPGTRRWEMTPAAGPDETLPHLGGERGAGSGGGLSDRPTARPPG